LLGTVLVDEGSEAGSLLPFARSEPTLTNRVTGFTATVERNAEMWGSLAARLHGQTISIPLHERLLAELRSLRQESFSFGSRWRVVDSSKKLHRDVSLALAGAVYAAGEAARAGNPELILLGGDRATATEAAEWRTGVPQYVSSESKSAVRWDAIERGPGGARGNGLVI
jgi:hypothetical protein